jgi:hypothetical protein
VHSELVLDGVVVVSLNTVAHWQWRLNWSKGCVKQESLSAALARLSRAQDSDLRLVACHHPLVDADTHTHGTGSTRGGKLALEALAQAGAHAVLSGHIHDAFDLQVETGDRPIRLIGAGTLSERLRATRPSYNRLDWSRDQGLQVSPQNLV